MNKKIIVAFIAAMLVLTGCSSNPYKMIDTVKAQEMIDKKETFILVFSRDGCSACAEYETQMKTVVKTYKVSVYDLMINKEMTNYSEIISFLQSSLGQSPSQTPTTYFIKDGAVSQIKVGSVAAEDFAKLLLQNGYISEIKK